MVWALGDIHLLAGEIAEADAALAACDVGLLPELLGAEASLRVPIAQGRVLLARGDHAGAIEIADTVLDRLDRMGIRSIRADAMLLKGRALAATGMISEAAPTLREARASAESLGHRRILWEILFELSRTAGVSEQETLLKEAGAIVESIAAALEEDLRASFLQRPEVRSVLN